MLLTNGTSATRNGRATSFLKNALSTTLFALALATPVFAQDNKDSVTLKNGNTESGRIKSEDYGGLVIDAKGEKTIPWNDIANAPGSIRYGNATQYDSAKDQFDQGKYAEALKAFDELKSEKGTRPPIKQNVLYYGALAQQRLGKTDEALAGYKELLTAFPKSRYLLPVGENFVTIYLGKGDAAGAAKALDQLSTDASTAGVDAGLSAGINVLKGRVLEDQKKFPEAQASYAVAEKATGAQPAVVQQAILGQARCAVALGDKTKAEGLFRKVVNADGPSPVMAGAWNGLGDLLLEEGKKGTGGKADPDKINDALYCYLRGVVLYSPLPDESTDQYERAIFYSSECFKFLGQLETKPDAKAAQLQRSQARLDQLKREFPQSPYLTKK